MNHSSYCTSLLFYFFSQGTFPGFILNIMSQQQKLFNFTVLCNKKPSKDQQKWKQFLVLNWLTGYTIGWNPISNLNASENHVCCCLCGEAVLKHQFPLNYWPLWKSLKNISTDALCLCSLLLMFVPTSQLAVVLRIWSLHLIFQLKSAHFSLGICQKECQGERKLSKIPRKQFRVFWYRMF